MLKSEMNTVSILNALSRVLFMSSTIESNLVLPSTNNWSKILESIPKNILSLNFPYILNCRAFVSPDFEEIHIVLFCVLKNAVSGELINKFLKFKYIISYFFHVFFAMIKKQF